MGGEFRVNTIVTKSQFQPSIAGLTGGGFVVAWTSDGQDGSGLGVYAQRYTAAGVKTGIEFRVNTTPAGAQSSPSVAALKDGSFVVAWQSDGQDGSGLGVYAQRFTAAGVKQSVEFRVNTRTIGAQSMPSATGLGGGGFVVAWQSDGQDGSGLGVYAQRYDSAGAKAGVEFRVNTAIAGAQSLPSASGLQDGGLAIAWQSAGQDGSGLGVYWQRYTAAGVKAGTEFRANTTVVKDQSQPRLAGFPDGGFVVSWASRDQDAIGLGVYGQNYNAAGARLDIEFRLNTMLVKDQSQPALVTAPLGAVVAAWTSKDQDGSLEGVYGQRFTLGR